MLKAGSTSPTRATTASCASTTWTARTGRPRAPSAPSRRRERCTRPAACAWTASAGFTSLRRAATTAYWLTGYAAENGPPDEATATAALLLTAKQEADGHWDFEDSALAPLQAGDLTTTTLAVRVLQKYGPKDRADELAKHVEKARQWLLRAAARTTDDQAYRLYGLAWTRSDKEEIAKGAARLVAEQRADGGWAQQDKMPGDAYATGLALRALHEAGGLATTAPAYRRGVAYLLRTRHDDGSWFVRTRAIPSNPYFESGFPHGRSQFISYAGTCQATMALLLTVERP